LPRSVIFLALLLLAPLGATPARAWTYGDTLTVIMKPLPNLPALARPGDAITVWALAPSGAGAWSASITVGTLTIPLGGPSGAYDAALGRWVLAFTVPPGTPEELYDLSLSSNATLLDMAQHAVKVLPAYRSSFYFAQISDTHLPEHTFSNGSIDTADTSGMADFDAVIADLNLIHPEFILHTGDFVNEGELEEYLGMFEMGRAQQMISRLRDPMFLSSGNHDIGGWLQTAPPAGTSRKDWWRYFGWPWLAAPPAADPWHSQDYSFDYGLLHCIGLEAYLNNNNGTTGYDNYLPALYGAQSMTAEQMNWLAADVAAVPAGHTKLAFFHYDFGGTLPNGSAAAPFSQFNNLPALGLDGVIWGHNHGVAEGNRTVKPFNLGLQSVIYNSVAGGRTFRIFRVTNGVISPGPMHHSGSTTDSLTAAWSGPNDGTRSALSATLTNRFGEAWDSARLVFTMVDHDSSFVATGGTLVQTIRQSGKANVYVDCVIPARTGSTPGTVTVSVAASAPLVVGVEPAALPALSLDPPAPNPFRGGAPGPRLRFSLANAADVRLDILDPAGRRVATPIEGRLPAGSHEVLWNGAGADGAPVATGLYFVRLAAAGHTLHHKLLILR
jgi:hypothetical protein